MGRSPITNRRHERPFQTTGKSGSSTSSKPTGLNLVDDPVSAAVQNILGAVPVTPLHGTLEASIMLVVQISENSVLVLQTAMEQSCSCRQHSRHILRRSQHFSSSNK